VSEKLLKSYTRHGHKTPSCTHKYDHTNIQKKNGNVTVMSTTIAYE